MIFINEFLPNPVGNDTSGEWVELFNSGNNSVSLDGWKVVSGGSTSLTVSSSKFLISGKNIGAGGFLVLPRGETKLVLKNTDGNVSLYDASGKLIDSAGFLGSAPEGKSFGRINYNDHDYNNDNVARLVWSEPSPGAANVAPSSTAIVENIYPVGVPLNNQLGAAEFIGLMLGVAVVLTSLIVFTLKRDEKLSKLFFGGNEKIR